jgi:predicted RNase H-like nuclease (RuvC/YqgF family)
MKVVESTEEIADMSDQRIRELLAIRSNEVYQMQERLQEAILSIEHLKRENTDLQYGLEDHERVLDELELKKADAKRLVRMVEDLKKKNEGNELTAAALRKGIKDQKAKPKDIDWAREYLALATKLAK